MSDDVVIVPVVILLTCSQCGVPLLGHKGTWVSPAGQLLCPGCAGKVRPRICSHCHGLGLDLEARPPALCGSCRK